MSEPAFSLITLHDYWDNYRQRVNAALAPLSAEQLALPAAPNQPIGELFGHLVGARFWWFHQWMGEPEPPALVDWGTDQDLRDATSLLNALELTWQVISPALRRWTAADMQQVFPPPASVAPGRASCTREWIVWHVLEHEIHHGGELSLALGSHGLQPLEM